jgi:hypothetical protein
LGEILREWGELPSFNLPTHGSKFDVILFGAVLFVQIVPEAGKGMPILAPLHAFKFQLENAIVAFLWKQFND